jgi:hypothetical protein
MRLESIGGGSPLRADGGGRTPSKLKATTAPTTARRPVANA